MIFLKPVCNRKGYNLRNVHKIYFCNDFDKKYECSLMFNIAGETMVRFGETEQKFAYAYIIKVRLSFVTSLAKRDLIAEEIVSS